MSKFKIVNLIDKIFISVCVFLIVFAWINFYLRSLWTTFVLSLIFSSAILYLMYYFFSKKTDRINLDKKTNEEINKYHLAFRLMPKKEKFIMLNKILSQEYECLYNNNLLIYKKNDKKHLVLVATQYERLSYCDILSLIEDYNIENIDSIDIICNDYSPNINTKIFLNKDIVLINKNSLYDNYFKKYNIFPDISNIDTSVNKLKLKDILINMFMPAKAKGYFFCGLILIFSSIILPYQIYYLIVGSILITFSIACKIIPFINFHHKSE